MRDLVNETYDNTIRAERDRILKGIADRIGVLNRAIDRAAATLAAEQQDAPIVVSLAHHIASYGARKDELEKVKAMILEAEQ